MSTSNKYSLYPFRLEENLSEMDSIKKVIRNACPPLHPDRFRRKMKFLLGIDIEDYPKNSVIRIGDFDIYKDDQLFRRNMSSPPPLAPWGLPPEPPIEDYIKLNKVILYNDSGSLNYFRNLEIQDIDERYGDFISYGNLLFVFSYSTPFEARENIIDFLSNFHRNPNELLNMGGWQTYHRTRKSDLFRDALLLYIKNVKKGISKSELGSFSPDLYEYDPWRNSYSIANDYAGHYSFLICLDDSEFSNQVIKSNKKDPFGVIPEISRDIIKNDYFGYTILREFLTNPLREIPSLDKIGKNFKANVKRKANLLLEPKANSLYFDIINSTEEFIAYEMGHDDYYFIEIEKPVESPIAGADGYAMIVDRTEIVRGYLPKNVVEKITDAKTLESNKYTDISKSKTGVINDPDGYTNIRSEQNTKSTLVGKIWEEEVFNYWETDSSWYIVQTKEGLRGYVYKSRIKEKYNTGGWTLD